MGNKSYLLPLLALITLSGCLEKKEDKNAQGHESEHHEAVKNEAKHDVPGSVLIRANREVTIPKELVKIIEEWYVAERRAKEKLNTSSESELVAEIERQLLDVNIHLSPINNDELIDEGDLKIPTGGGIIDFADLLKGDKGGFSMAISLDKVPEGSDVRAFYVSQARQRELSDASYGAGCGRWMEITKWFKNHSHGHEMDLYATDRRHISVTAGTWLFFALHEKQLWLGTLSFTDSRFPALMCSK